MGGCLTKMSCNESRQMVIHATVTASLFYALENPELRLFGAVSPTIPIRKTDEG
jgi:hypothetical protein